MRATTIVVLAPASPVDITLAYPRSLVASSLKNLSQDQLEKQDSIRTDMRYHLADWEEGSVFLQVDEQNKVQTLEAISSAVKVFNN